MKKEQFDEWKESNSNFEITEALIRQQMKRRRTSKFNLVFRSALCVFSLLFILSNTSDAFVSACSQLPFLKDIVALLDLSPSVQRALDHDYVQVLDQTIEKEDIQVKLEFLVADERRIDLFYTVSRNGERLRLDQYNIETNDTMEDIVSSGSYYSDEEYEHYTFEVLENQIPNKLSVTISAYRTEIPFDVEIDTSKIAKKKEILVNQTYEIDGQYLTIEKVEVYPLSMRIYTSQAESNSYKIRHLDFTVKEFDLEIKNGLSRTGEIYILESPYFIENNFEIILNSCELIPKDLEIIYDVETQILQDPSGYIQLVDVIENDEDGEYTIAITTHKQLSKGTQLMIVLDDFSTQTISQTTRDMEEGEMIYYYGFPKEEVEKMTQIRFKLDRRETTPIHESIYIDLDK